MVITSLQLTDYRNYRTLDLNPTDGLNILVGANGQGKSNILEAIYLLATTRSLRAHRDHELIRMGADLARVVARIDRKARTDVTIEIDVLANQKVGKVNGVRHSRLIDLLGECHAVQFTPTDVDLITGPPAIRRGFLNLQIAQASGGYAYALVYYRRVLEQRNRLLKDASRQSGLSAAGRQTLDALTEQLLLHGGQILERRVEFIASLGRFGNRIHQELAESPMEVIYRPGWGEGDSAVDPTAESLRAALEAARPQELRRGLTVAGPHRDDLQVKIAGLDARTFGSRGEQRTAALSLKLAEFLQLQDISGEPPILLLDDVLSELDDERSRRVIAGSTRQCQTFLTGASRRSLPPELLAGARVFEIRGGVIASEHSDPSSSLPASSAPGALP